MCANLEYMYDDLALRHLETEDVSSFQLILTIYCTLKKILLMSLADN